MVILAPSMIFLLPPHPLHLSTQVRFFRDMATAIAKRVNSELLLTYGTLWKSSSA